MSDVQYDSELMYVAPTEPPPSRRPPPLTVGPVGWLRKNLFSGWVNTFATILTIVVIVLFLQEFFRWVVAEANWAAVTTNLRLFTIGQYDRGEEWRISLSAGILVALSGLSLGLWASSSRMLFIILIILTGFTILAPIVGEAFEPAPIRMIVAHEEYEFNAVSPMLFVGDEGDEVTLAVEPIDRNSYATEEESPFPGYIEDNRTLIIDNETEEVSLKTGTQSQVIWNNVKRDAGRSRNPLDLTNYNLLLTVQLLNADGEVLEELVSTPNSRNVSFTYTLPEDGWYIVQPQRHTNLYNYIDGLRVPTITGAKLAEARQYAEQHSPGEPYTFSTMGFAWVRIDGVDIFSNKPSEVEERIETYGPLPEVDTCGEVECRRTVEEKGLRYDGDRSLSQFLHISLPNLAEGIMWPIVGGFFIILVSWFIGIRGRRIHSDDQRKLINRVMLILWVLYMPVSWFLVRGFEDPNTIPLLELPEVDPESWGGLLLTMVLTFIPIAFSLPIGILLALGRQSKLPIISTASTLSIELVRGVPLITLLFMASLLVGFFDTSLRDVNDVIKMMVALTIFSAAYLAEVVRGGLQIISKGQVEAAQALGLNPVLTTLFITLPQALRAVIPAIMSQFVSLFKDTSLVVIIGLFELVGVARRLVPAQEGGIFSAASRETYLFVGIIYFVISYAMSAVSRELEETGAGAARQ